MQFVIDDKEAEIFVKPEEEEKELKVRLDKWLWAARFFKTRALARSAVESGKVLYDDERAKPSIEIKLGSKVSIEQGNLNKIVEITGLSTRRRSTDESRDLYIELSQLSQTSLRQNRNLGRRRRGAKQFREHPQHVAMGGEYSFQNSSSTNYNENSICDNEYREPSSHNYNRLEDHAAYQRSYLSSEVGNTNYIARKSMPALTYKRKVNYTDVDTNSNQQSFSAEKSEESSFID